MTALPDSLSVTIEGEIAVVALTRPAKRNALDMATVNGLAAFFSGPPQGVKAAVLVGEGPHFCAGLDLSEMVAVTTPMASVTHSRAWHRAFQEIEFGVIPVISVMHGAVIGGGLELAAATHVRVAERTAYYGLPEGQRGLFLGGGGSVRISRMIGAHRVMEMMLTGRTLAAEEALGLGLTHYLVEPGEGRAKGIALARKIAGNASGSNYAIINALPRIAASAPEAGLMTESLTAAFAEGAPETRQRLKDFLEKRADKVTRD